MATATPTIENKIAEALEADAAAGHDPEAPTEVAVRFDVFAWVTDAPKGSKGRYVHHAAGRGDVVTVRRAVAIRGQVLGAVELTDGSSSAESTDLVDLLELDADELGKVPAADVLAFISQQADDEEGAENVAELAQVEAQRGSKARTSVLKAAGWSAEDIAAAKG